MAIQDVTHDLAARRLVRADHHSIRSLYESNRFWRFWRTHCFCPGLRAEAASYFTAGDRVLEIGCGNGKNFPHLMRRLGPNGKLYATDFSKAMVDDARRRVEDHGWHKQIEVTHADVLTYEPRGPLDGVLFSCSYQVLPSYAQREQLLWRLMKNLRAGSRIVVADIKVPEHDPQLRAKAKSFAAGFYGSDPQSDGAWLEMPKVLQLKIHHMNHHWFGHYTFDIVIP